MSAITLDRTEISHNFRGFFDFDTFRIFFRSASQHQIIQCEKNPPKDSGRVRAPGSIILPLPVKGFTNYFHRLMPQYPEQFVYQMTETMGSNVRVIPILEHTSFSRGKVIPVKGSRFLYGGIAPRNEEMFVEELQSSCLEIYRSGDIEKFVREYWKGR